MIALQMYSVRDEKAGAFLRPFCADTHGLAVRSFGDAVRDPEHEMHRHAEDYSLWYVGTFDCLEGSVVGVVPAECLILAVNLKENGK